MEIRLETIEMREILHFLGWRGAKVERELMLEIRAIADHVLNEVTARAVMLQLPFGDNGTLEGTAFYPQGKDIAKLLSGCSEVCLLAVTLGAQSERMILREQARSNTHAVLLDAVLSAYVEAACDQIEEMLREQLLLKGLYLTDRFSPGYGDMPMEQTREICEVLSAFKAIGLSVSGSGIMIPRKSVTAVMGISRFPVERRPDGCAGCPSRDTCEFAKRERTSSARIE